MGWRDTLGTDLRSLIWGPPDRVERQGKPWAGPLYASKSHYLRDLLLVTDQLASIVRSDAALGEGLDAATADAPAYHLKRLLTGLADDLDSGQPLWRALSWRPRFFPAYYAGLIRAGEESGRLNESFAALRAILLSAAELRSRAVQYGAYIAIVWVFIVAVGAYLQGLVLPNFAELLEDFGATVPDLQAALQRVQWVWVVTVIAALAVGVVVLKLILHLMRGSRALSTAGGRVLLAVPVARGLTAKRNLAHTARVLETLLRARVPLDEALETAAEAGVHPAYARALERVRGRVRTGLSLHDALAGERVFLRSFRGFVSVGESSGKLPEALERIDRLYRRQVARTERILLDMVSPLGILAAGAVVFAFVLSVLEVTVRVADALGAGVP